MLASNLGPGAPRRPTRMCGGLGPPLQVVGHLVDIFLVGRHFSFVKENQPLLLVTCPCGAKLQGRLEVILVTCRGPNTYGLGPWA